MENPIKVNLSEEEIKNISKLLKKDGFKSLDELAEQLLIAYSSGEVKIVSGEDFTPHTDKYIRDLEDLKNNIIQGKAKLYTSVEEMIDDMKDKNKKGVYLTKKVYSSK